MLGRSDYLTRILGTISLIGKKSNFIWEKIHNETIHLGLTFTFYLIIHFQMSEIQRNLRRINRIILISIFIIVILLIILINIILR